MVGCYSRQLHDQAENNRPREGVFVWNEPLKACFHKVCEKQKEQCGALAVVFYLQDRSQGTAERSEAPPLVQDYSLYTSMYITEYIGITG